MQHTRATHRVAMVSGGLGDIGSAIAVELASRGIAVALGDLPAPCAADSLLRQIRSLSGEAHYTQVDVTDHDAVTSWTRRVADELALPTIIIPNAATVTPGGAVAISAEGWRRELDVNLNGSFHLARSGARQMLDHGLQGRIVFIGSWAGHAPHAKLAAYSVAKAGLRMLCKCMAMELAGSGITVNEVAPGYVDAGLSAKLFRDAPELREASAAQVPNGHLLDAGDVAEQVAYFCLDASPHVTGTTLVIDGGLSLCNPSGSPREATHAR